MRNGCVDKQFVFAWTASREERDREFDEVVVLCVSPGVSLFTARSLALSLFRRCSLFPSFSLTLARRCSLFRSLPETARAVAVRPQPQTQTRGTLASVHDNRDERNPSSEGFSLLEEENRT